jgi:hypothetical protein
MAPSTQKQLRSFAMPMPDVVLWAAQLFAALTVAVGNIYVLGLRMGWWRRSRAGSKSPTNLKNSTKAPEKPLREEVAQTSKPRKDAANESANQVEQPNVKQPEIEQPEFTSR